MIEIKFLKELPCRSLNNNSTVLSLRGADMYVDKDGNRFIYIALSNNYKKPFFSLYLYIKEYDASGSLIKEEKYSAPTTYGETGMYIIKEPIHVEKDCDAIDVFISLAEFGQMIFYKDSFTKTSEMRVESAFFTPTSAATKFSQPRTVESTKAFESENVSEDGEEPSSNSEAPKQAPVSYTANKNVKAVGLIPDFGPILAAIIAVIFFILSATAAYEIASWDMPLEAPDLFTKLLSLINLIK